MQAEVNRAMLPSKVLLFNKGLVGASVSVLFWRWGEPDTFPCAAQLKSAVVCVFIPCLECQPGCCATPAPPGHFVCQHDTTMMLAKESCLARWETSYCVSHHMCRRRAPAAYPALFPRSVLRWWETDSVRQAEVILQLIRCGCSPPTP